MNQAIRRHRSFWRDAVAWTGSITPYVMPHIIMTGLVASAICGVAFGIEKLLGHEIGLEVAPHEIAAAALGLLLVLRTNAGYDRWWEARKVWGGIVNQTRNIVISGLSYGPNDEKWREELVKWTAIFPHTCRWKLRGEAADETQCSVMTPADARELNRAEHMPNLVAYKIANLLKSARNSDHFDGFAFMQIDRERALLIDYIGKCERILATPLARVYSIKVRRFLALFLMTLPFPLLHKVEEVWLIPLLTMAVAYPLVSLDQIGIELQNPFAKENLSHLPIGQICCNIEGNLLALLIDDPKTHVPVNLEQMEMTKSVAVAFRS